MTILHSKPRVSARLVHAACLHCDIMMHMSRIFENTWLSTYSNHAYC